MDRSDKKIERDAPDAVGKDLTGSAMRILGIDPGSTVTGFGVVEHQRGGLLHIAHGVLRAPRQALLPERLAFLYTALRRVLDSHKPDRAVVERVFVALSPAAALVLGQARGVALAALAAEGIPIEEWAATTIKQAVTGNGAATKGQVQSMVTRLLGLEAEPPRDAADALAAAIGCAHVGEFPALVGRSAGVGRRAAELAARTRRRRPARFVLRRGP